MRNLVNAERLRFPLLGDCIDRAHGLHMFGYIGYTMRHRVLVVVNDHATEDGFSHCLCVNSWWPWQQRTGSTWAHCVVLNDFSSGQPMPTIDLREQYV